MITLQQATDLIAKGEQEARNQGLNLAFAVVDAGGHLVALHRAYANQGLVCISVTVDDAEGREAALKFLRSKKADFLNLALDEKPTFWQKRWGGNGTVPIVFVFDKHGKRAGKFDDASGQEFNYTDHVIPLVKRLLSEQ